MNTIKTSLTAIALWGALALPSMAQDIAYTLTNDSSMTLVQFFTSSASDPEWGDDILGDQVVAPGESGTVTLTGTDGECVFDIMMVMEDGAEVTDQVDACAMASYTLVD